MWNKDYRQLKKGEIIKEGDEVGNVYYNEDGRYHSPLPYIHTSYFGTFLSDDSINTQLFSMGSFPFPSLNSIHFIFFVLVLKLDTLKRVLTVDIKHASLSFISWCYMQCYFSVFNLLYHL